MHVHVVIQYLMYNLYICDLIIICENRILRYFTVV